MFNFVDKDTPTNKKIICPDCDGKKEVPYAYGGTGVTYGTCWRCHGQGELISIGKCGICKNDLIAGCTCKLTTLNN